MCNAFSSTLEQIIALLEEAGYDSSAQLCGYLTTGQATYITRTGGAREMIEELDKAELRRYVDENGSIAK